MRSLLPVILPAILLASGCTIVGAGIGAQFNERGESRPPSTVEHEIVGERILVLTDDGVRHDGVLLAVLEGRLVLETVKFDFAPSDPETLLFEAIEGVRTESGKTGTYTGSLIGLVIDVALGIRLYNWLDRVVGY